MTLSRPRSIRRIVIPLFLCALTAVAAQSPAPPAAPEPGSPVATPAPPPAKPKLIDINTARIEQLMTLPGVSERVAQLIIEGRPYRSRVNLKTRNVIPSKTYDAILSRIVAKSPRFKAK